MRHTSKYLAGLVVLAMVATSAVIARAADEKPAPGAGKPALLHGHIKKIDGKTITVAIGKGADEKDVEVKTDDTTHFSIDHKPATLADLKEGELVAVAPMEGVAQHVDVNTTHKDHAHGTGDKPAGDKPAPTK